MMTSNAYNALLAIGANEPMKKDFRGSFAIIGFTGKRKPGFVKQVDHLRYRGPSIVEELITFPYTVCPKLKDLGMKNRKIQDYQISASSVWNSNARAGKARLDYRAHNKGIGSWIAKTNDVSQWLQVDFKTSTFVGAIKTQGREDCCNQFVKTYTVSWSNCGRVFYPYRRQGKAKIFMGNKDRHSVVEQILSPPIVTKFIRVKPLSWNEHISLRLEFVGC